MDAVFALDNAPTTSSPSGLAAKDFEVPSQNLIYADTKGHIGYQAPGRIPVRADGVDGTMPAPGWDSKYTWKKGYIPFDALPYEYNPQRGFIVTANQAVIDDKKYPYLLTKDWGYGTRSQRINDLIESKIKGGGKISTEDMQKMQMDNSSEIAALLTPALLKIDVTDPSVREAQKLLEGWDYTQENDSAAAAYFNAVWRNVLKLAFGNKLPKELRAQGRVPVRDSAGRHGPGRRPRQEGPGVRRARRRLGAARRRRPLVRGRPQDLQRPEQQLVAVARDPSGQGHHDPRPAARARHEGRPLGADRQARQGHHHLDAGAGCTS